ncbi:MAG: ABC transporter permease [Phycisphaerales bacterium]|nr:MAG: ABC transporter permease [Phycisphaerales bacterium]
MIAHIVRRLLLGILTIACVYTLTFVMVISIPGNPFQQSERNMPPEAEQALRVRYSMDNNWLYFWEFIDGAVHLDFGPAFTYNDWTCNQIIADSLPVSVLIGLMAIVLAVLVGVPLGVISAVRRGGWVDMTVSALVLAGISVPTFVAGTFLLIVFAVYLKIAPVGGWGTLAHLPLPAITLSLPFIAYIARLTRMGMLDVLSSDFIRTALAKGVSPRNVVWNHALKVAFLPVLSFLGPATAQAMTGSFVVEKVFGVPGIGQHFVNAALNLDAGLIMSTVLVFATLLVFMNLLIDVLYMWIDPRIAEAV